MVQKSIPKFYGLRIYLSSILLYFFLVLPFIGFIAFQNVPKFIENRGGTENLANSVDSMRTVVDSIQVLANEDVDSLVSLAIQGDIDSLVHKAIELEESREDTLSDGIEANILIDPETEDHERLKMFEEKGPFSRYFILLFILIFVSLMVGWIYNSPFKRLFRFLRRKKEIPPKLQAKCKKRLFSMPLINSIIVTMPNIVVIIYSLIFLVSEVSLEAGVERSMFIQLHYLTIVATLLEFLFVYYWEKHRVHIRYIDHIYPEVELRKQVFRRKRWKNQEPLYGGQRNDHLPAPCGRHGLPDT